MTPHIDGEHHEERPVLHDFYYAVIDGVPVLSNSRESDDH